MNFSRQGEAVLDIPRYTSPAWIARPNQPPIGPERATVGTAEEGVSAPAAMTRHAASAVLS